jgi:hypothetical protein
MTLTPLWLTGFEHALLSSLGGGLFDAVTALTAINSDTPRSGSYYLRCSPSGAAVANVQTNSVNGQSRPVIRFALRANTLPTSGQSGGVAVLGTASGLYPGIRVSSAGVLTLTNNAGTVIVTGPTLTAGVWYVVEWGLNMSANPWGYGLKVNGTLYAATEAVAATTAATLWIGDGWPLNACVLDYDDVIVGGSNDGNSNDWFGVGRVLGLVAGVDGTHTFTTTQASEGDGTSTYITVDTHDAYLMVDDAPPWSTSRSASDNIGQRASSANYAEIGPAATSEGGANGVRALISYSSSTTSTNNAACIARNSAGAATTLRGDWTTRAGYNVTSNNFAGGMVTKPAAGWTADEISAVRIRFGNSNDASPVPTVQAFMLEVDIPGSPVNAAACSLKWDTVALVNAAADSLIWDLLASQAVDASAYPLVWDLIAQVNTAANTLKWDVITTVNAAADSLKWDLRGAIDSVAETLFWNLITTVNAGARTLGWEILSGGQVNSISTRLVWDTIAQVTAAADALKWDLSNPIDGGVRIFYWDMNQVAVDGDAYSLFWDMITQLVKTETLIWDTAKEMDAAATLSLIWTLPNPMSATARALVWDMRAWSSSVCRFKWYMKADVSAAIAVYRYKDAVTKTSLCYAGWHENPNQMFNVHEAFVRDGVVADSIEVCDNALKQVLDACDVLERMP